MGPFRSGVSYDGRADLPALRYLASRGVTWLAVIPFGYGQRDASRPPDPDYRFSSYPGESISDARDIVRAAKQAGLQVLLKPHLWFFRHDAWRGDIAMTNEVDWERFFSAYRGFLGPFLDLSAELQVEAFCLGTELSGTTKRERQWRDLVGWARKRYSGELTYAAHWDGEVESIGFWDSLDFIGVQAYYPLSVAVGDSTDRLVRAWKPWMDQLSETSQKHAKPIVLTEIGYRARADATVRPWEWDQRGQVDVTAQATAYSAIFRVLADAPWLEGMFIWKWPAGYSGMIEGSRPPRRGRFDGGFSPQGYPAEQIIFEWFRQRGRSRH